MTHALFGYALSRAVPGHDRAAPARQRAEVFTAIVASNIPDADAVLGLFASDRQLSYLLEHRGATHTLLAALPLGVITAFACAELCGARSARDRVACAWLGVLACVLHIAFDGLNNYGVHPLSPFDNHWYYGDSVFIVEPLLLIALLPLVAWRAHTGVGRAMGFALGVLVLSLLWLPRTVPREVAVVLSVLLSTAFVLERRVRRPALVTLLSALLVVVLFAVSARQARAEVMQVFARGAPRERVFDVVSTPSPGNPLCFSVLVLSLDDHALYRVHFAHVSLAPALLPVAQCKVMPRGPTTAPLDVDPVPSSASVHLEGAFEADPSQLRRLAGAYCDARAMLRFIRVPYWVTQGAHPLLGDLRYDSNPKLEFAERELNDVCRESFPNWTPPRADLLHERL